MKILKKEVVWQGKYLRIVLFSYEDSHGNIRQWEAVERVNCSGIVIVIPVTKDKEFVFIRQFRPVLAGYVIEFPAGLNDRKESLIEVAKRELIEETGLFSDEIVFLAEMTCFFRTFIRNSDSVYCKKCQRSSRRCKKKLSS